MILSIWQTPTQAMSAPQPTSQALTSAESGLRLSLSSDGFYVFPDGTKCPLNDCHWFVGYDYQHNITLENLGEQTATDLVLVPDFENMYLTAISFETFGDIQGISIPDGKMHIGQLPQGSKLIIHLTMVSPAVGLASYDTQLFRENETEALDGESIAFLVASGQPDPPSDVAVSVVGPNPLTSGVPAIFAITATNNSDHPAKELVAAVDAGSPQILLSVSLDPSGLPNMFEHDKSSWKFNLPELAPHATGTVYCTIVSENTAFFGLSADVLSTNFEPNYANNGIFQVINVITSPQ